MKLVGRLAVTEDGLAHLKKIQKVGHSKGLIIPAEVLYALGEPKEFLIYIKDSCIIAKPYNGEKIILDATGNTR